MKSYIKNVLFVFCVMSCITACSSDFNPDIPINSNDLIDQNIVYKEDLVAVEVENAPTHSLDKKIEDINEEEPSENIEILEKEEVIEKKVEEQTKTDTETKEIQEDKKTDSSEKNDDNLKQDEKKNTSNVFIKEKDEEISMQVLPEDEEMTEKEIEALKKQIEEENVEIIDIPSNTAKKDEVIDVVEESYETTEETEKNEETNNVLLSEKVLNYDEEFESAVRQAEEKRGINKDIKKKPKMKSKKDFKLNVKEEPKTNITFLSAIIYHSNTKADISKKDMKALKKVADFINANEASVRIVGNSSSRTKNMKELDNKIKNFDLSLLRAQKVKEALVKQGVDEKKIFIDAVSDTEKVIEENMPINEAINRRTEIYITY